MMDTPTQQQRDALGLLGRTFRIGDAVDGTVVKVSLGSDGCVQVNVVWWNDKDRKECWIAPHEIGAAVAPPPSFGFAANGSTP